MRSRLHSKLVAALVAPALIASAAAQGLLLMKCGAAVSMASSCCCPKPEAPPASTTVSADAAGCCSTVALPTSPPQTAPDRAVTTAPAPVLVALAAAPAVAALPLVRRGPVPQLDPPPGPSAVLANCSLLI